MLPRSFFLGRSSSFGELGEEDEIVDDLKVCLEAVLLANRLSVNIIAILSKWESWTI